MSARRGAPKRMEVARAIKQLLDDEEAWAEPDVARVRLRLLGRIPRGSPAVGRAARAFVEALAAPEVETRRAVWVREWVESRYASYVRPRRRAVLAAVESYRRPWHILTVLSD